MRTWISWPVLLVGLGCQPPTAPGPKAPPDAAVTAPKPPEGEAPGKEAIVPPVAAAEAPPPSPRLPDVPPLATIRTKTESWFQGRVGRRIHLQADKPMYQPGETIWLRIWDLRAKDLATDHGHPELKLELVSPKGSVVMTKRLRAELGVLTTDLELPDSAQGGEYKLRATPLDGAPPVERPLIVSTYEPPQIKKKLEFVRKAYGPGDEVTATVSVKRSTGEPLANHPLRGVAILDGEPLTPVSLKTNDEGGALVAFLLPKRIERGDGLLTVMVEHGGITESISKSIPIVLKKIELSFFPEGGQMISGVPGRMYFAAKNSIGKPADVEGRIVDDQGNAIATFRTHHFGVGRMGFTPSTGRTYHAEIVQPVGITEKYPIPLPAKEGCALSSFDDFDGQVEALRVAVRCSPARKVIVAGLLREELFDVAAVEAGESTPAVVHLSAGSPEARTRQGVARVTVFDEALNPLAERLVYRNRRGGLQIEVTPDRPTYSPRDKVTLAIKTQDAKGQPLAAELAMSVVDDTVVSYADDKTGHLLAKVFLEPELPDTVEEPNFFFDLKEKKSAEAMDNLMGTRGFRKFEWAHVWNPPPPPRPVRPRRPDPNLEGLLKGLDAQGALGGQAAGDGLADLMGGGIGDIGLRGGGAGGIGRGGIGGLRQAGGGAGVEGKAEPKRPANGGPRPPGAPARPAPRPAAPAPARAAAPPRQAAPKPVAPPRELDPERAERRARLDANRVASEVDRDFAKDAKERKRLNEAAEVAVVRVFPVPSYTTPYSGPRSDFRETIYFAPAVKTDSQGVGSVSFHLSDAVTSFRVFAEGLAAGRAGRVEKVVRSSLPFSLAAKLPVEVSAGDQISMPLTLTNERDQPITVALEATFGDLLTVGAMETAPPVLAPGTKESRFYPLSVVGKRGVSKLRFVADAGGLEDELLRELTVVPPGFPISHTRSGTLEKRESLSVGLGEVVEGTIEAQLKLEPGPVGTLLVGLEGMLQEPYGCFEQTSSTHYPNVMIMSYLRSNRVADPDLVEKVSGLLDRGYQKLVGFEAQKKGYEWFGHSPAHEALTAYGLLEFVDMKPIYGGIDHEMVERTSKWLLSRRDGSGGFLRDGQALDSFGRADPDITDAYIVWALTEAKFTGLTRELDRQAKNAAETSDAYLLALATSALLNAGRPEAGAAVARLASMQAADGGFQGSKHSITRSTGTNLHVETTALALLALMKAKKQEGPVAAGVRWLYRQRSPHGAFGATQSTVLALKALTTYAAYSRRTQSGGTVTVKVNGAVAGTTTFKAGRREPIVLSGLGAHLRAGDNSVELELTGGGALPYTLGVTHRSITPASDPSTAVGLETKIARTSLRMGETVRVEATLTNRTAAGQPMTLARVGIPGGLNFQPWQLKELREKGLIAFYETRAREVILYFRELKPNEVKVVPIDLVAEVPGKYVGPASSAYLYYTNDKKHWVEGITVEISP